MALELGCSHGANTVSRDGFKLEKDTLAHDLTTIAAKAAFDLSCDQNALTIRILGVMSDLTTGPVTSEWWAVGKRRATRGGPYGR